MSPATARRIGLGDLLSGNDQSRRAPLVTLTVGERALELPAWVVPGHADGVVTLHLGSGRTRGGRLAEGAGFDAGAVRPSGSPWRVSSGVSVTPARGRYLLASTQDHHSMEGRHLVRMADLDDYLRDPEHAGAAEHHGPIDISLMKKEEFPYDGYAWGMSIDLTSCTGCNACLVACQSENNIPVVGKEQVARGREMHWIRVDRYFTGDDPERVEAVVNQPVPCMQCEQAPCEVVCPVGATVHSDEGLNDMVYNRCVGTRYCSNNCPYKVRRFNFLLYQDFKTPSLQLGRNPDVTIRSRGVMEKCTYCVQRINQARIAAKRDGGQIEDGEIVTACQGACPSQAIVFGDVNDPESKVSQAKASPLDFSLLEELGTRPRTTYLGRVRNPNRSLLARLGHGGNGDGEEGHRG
jgi:molybdopterin-containing oxidoreductase family iron-sulfur binding subunit